MNKILRWMFLLVLIGAMGTVQGQMVYFCDFEGADTLGWTSLNPSASNNWVIGTGTATTTGGRSLYVSDDGSSYHYSSVDERCYVPCVHDITILEDSKYEFSYDWKCVGFHWYDYMRVALVPSNMSIPLEIPYYFSSFLPEGWIALDDGYMNGTNTWTHYMKEVELEAGQYKLAVFWHNDIGRSFDYPAAIDNIKLKEACASPSDIVAYNKSENGFTLHWQCVNVVTSCNMEYGVSGFRRGSEAGTIVTGIDSNEYTLTGLEGSTEYDVYLWSECADEESEATKITVGTNCSCVDLPYDYDIISYRDGELPDCWTLISGKAGVNNDEDMDIHCVNIKENGCVALPRMAIPESGCIIEFFGYSYNNSALEVGYVTSLSNFDFHLMRSFAGTSHDYDYYIDSREVDEMPDSCYIVFKVSGGIINASGWNVSDVTVEKVSELPIPMNLRVTNATRNSLEFSWDSDVEGASFDVNYDWHVKTVDTTSITLSDLSEYRKDIRVRTKMGDSVSNWSERVVGLLDWKNVYANDVYTEAISDSAVNIFWEIMWDKKYDTMMDVDGYVIRFNEVSSYGVEGASTDIYIEGPSTSYCLTGLSPDKMYMGKIFAIQGTDTMYSSPIGRFKSGAPVENRLTGGDIGTENCVISNHNYNYSQSFYPSLGAIGLDSISGVAFHNVYYGYSRDVKMYIGFTDKFRLANVGQYVETEDLELVYDGRRYFDVGWDTIMFDHSVAVNHNKNIVIVLIDSTGQSRYMCYSSHHGFTFSGGGFDEVPLPGGGDMDYGMDWISMYSPDISFVGPASGITGCNPRLKRITPGAGSLSYEWDKMGTESSWTINYRKWGVDADWIVAAASIDEQSYTIEDLMPGEIYEVRIGSLVGGDTLYTYTEDRTLLGAYRVPYMEDFNGMNEMDPYWLTSNNYLMDMNVRVASNTLNMSSMGFVALPKFEVPINELMLSFAINDMSRNGEMIVGVCDNRNEVYSFVPIDTLVYDQYNPIRKWSAVLDGYDGEGENIVFYVSKGDFNIDTIWVDYIPNCVAPKRLQVVDVDKKYVKVNWQGAGEGQTWRATIVERGEALSEGRTIDCATNEALFMDLEAETCYDIYVYSVCGDERSEETMIGVKTLPYNLISLPFITNFKDSDENDMWRYKTIEGDGRWSISRYGVDKVMHIEDSIRSTVESSIALAYIPVKVEQDGRCRYDYDWIIEDEVHRDYLYMALAPYGFDFTSVSDYQYREKNLDGWIFMDYEGVDKNATSPTNGVTMVPEGVYYLILMYDHRVMSEEEIENIYHGRVSHIELDYVNCGKNDEAHVVNITKHSAMISWNMPSNDVEEWEIVLNDGQSAIVTDSYYEAENLNGGMWYEATIRSMCGEGAYGEPLKVNFATKCGDIIRLPYYNDFELEEEGESPHCWTVVSGDCWVENGVLIAKSGDENTTTRVALPMFADGIDFSEAKIAFDARGDNQFDAMEILMTDDLDDIATYEEIKHFDMHTRAGSRDEHFEVSLKNVEIKKYIVIFVMLDIGDMKSSPLKIYNFGIMPKGACEYPIEISVDKVGWDYITVSWESEAEQLEWEVKISDEEGHEIERRRVTEPTATFDGLVSGGQYSIKVRAICTEEFYKDGDCGKWTKSKNVTTNCGVVSNVNVTEITDHSAKVSWTPGNNQTHWNVIYGEAGFYNNLDEAMVVNTTEPEVTLTGLTSGKMYEVYVKSICNVNNYSMSMPLPFMTLGGEGIDGVAGEYDLNIYPNPTSRATTIRLSGVDGDVKISVVDMNGRLISDETMSCGGECEKRMVVEGMTRGTYFVRVVGDRINSVRKLVVH